MDIHSDVKVQIRFTIDGFTDALYIGLEEYAALTEDQIITMQQARYDNWKAIIESASNTPTPPVEPDLEVK